MTEQEKESSQVVNLTIDGSQISVPKGTTVYHAAKSLGAELPIFCYQDRMPPFGACRVCLVEVEKMGKLQTSCTLEAAEGMVVKTGSQLAVEGRESILEFLLINHPLDCPICDKGGECPLQDQTIAFGPDRSRFYEDKRRFTKAKPLGPLLMLDRERCIICARCTRFGELISGDHALQLMDRGFKTEVGTPGGEPVKSKFIGNTIMICPVGALTSEVYRFRARPWDNKPIPSTCTLCPVGCSMILDERDGEIMRTRTQENKLVNDIWMCDKGFFGYEFSSFRARLQKPMVRRNGQLEVASWDEALAVIAGNLAKSKPAGKIAGWGGNPLTTEENTLFQRMIREGGGTNHVDHRVGMPIFTPEEEGFCGGMEIPIGSLENLSSILLLGIDLTEEFPVLWLRIKQSLNRGGKAVFVGHYSPEIAPYLSQVLLHTPGLEIKTFEENPQLFLEFLTNKDAAIFIGRQYLALPHRTSILAHLLKIKHSHPHVSLNLLEGRGNSTGARWAGMHPSFGPFGKRLDKDGLSIIEVMNLGIEEGWDYLHVAGADPAEKYPTKLWEKFRQKLGFLVVQDIFLTETARRADVVLPSLCFLEKKGSFINIARNIQEINPGKEIPEAILSDGEIFNAIFKKLNLSSDENKIDNLKTDLGESSRSYEVSIIEAKNPSSKALKVTFAHSLFDGGVRMMHNNHLKEMIKEPRIRVNEKEATARSLFQGDTVRVKSGNASISAVLDIDSGVADGTVILPLGFKEIPVKEMGPNLLNGLEVEIST